MNFVTKSVLNVKRGRVCKKESLSLREEHVRRSNREILVSVVERCPNL